MSLDNVNNVAVRIPEFILYYGLKAGIQFVIDDYNNNLADTTKSLLFLFLENVGIERYEFFEQAKKVFITEVDDSRTLNVNLMYNREQNGVPSVYISMPSEQSGQNTLSFGEGNFDNYVDDTEYRPSLGRRFNATYAIVITSDNNNEVILIYHVLRAILMAMNAHFALAGLEQIVLSGGDLRNRSDIPATLNSRSINFTCQYETKSFDFSKYPLFNTLFFMGTPYLQESIDNCSTTTTSTTTIAPTTTTTTTVI